MKISLIIVACAAALTLAAVPLDLAYAQQSKMKACAEEWNKMKAAKQTAGKSYRDFSKECMSRTGDSEPATAATKPAMSTPAAAPAAPAAKKETSTAAKPAATTKSEPAATTGKAGREAMVARERACGQDWKADKEAGKVPKGMTWPKYWSECDKRKKAEGM